MNAPKHPVSLQPMAGMTLLEVVFSLAILGGSIAVISEMAHSSFQNARMARDMIQAELLAESILAKLRLGIIAMEPAYKVPVTSESYGNRSDIIEDTHAVAVGNTSIVLWHVDLVIRQ